MADDAALLNEIQALIDAQEPGLSLPEEILGASRSYLAGPTYGFSNKLEALAASQIGQETYDQELARINAQQDRYKRKRPVASTLIEMGSGMFLNPLAKYNGLWGNVAQGALGGVGETRTDRGETYLGQAAKGMLWGTAAHGAGEWLGDVFRNSGKESDRLLLSSYGLRSTDLSKVGKKAGIKGTKRAASVPDKFIKTIKRAESKGLIGAGENAADNAGRLAQENDILVTKLNRYIDDADAVLEPSKDFSFDNTQKYIDSLTGTKRDDVTEQALDEIIAIQSQMSNGGTLADLQDAKRGLNYKWQMSPNKEHDVIKHIQTDLRREIEKRYDAAVNNGLLDSGYKGAIKDLNSEWGENAELRNIFLNRVPGEYAGDIIEDIYSQGRTSGGVGSLIQSALMGGGSAIAPVAVGLSAARMPRSKRALSSVLEKVSNTPYSSEVGDKLSEGWQIRAGEYAGGGAIRPMTGRVAMALSDQYRNDYEQQEASPVVTDDLLLERINMMLSESKKKDSAMMNPNNYDPLIEQAAKKEGIDPLLFKSLVEQESGYRPDVRSSAGAVGLTQIMPRTGRELASKLGLPDYDLTDPETNLAMGARYLRELLDMFGDTELALTAYNQGMGNVRRHLKNTGGNSLDDIIKEMGPDGQKYARSILSRL